MAYFSKIQKRIAQYLMDGPKTIEQLTRDLDVEKERIYENLDKLIELQTVTLNNKIYTLKPELVQEFKKRKEISVEDPYKLRLLAYIELQAIEENLLKKALAELVNRLEKFPGIGIFTTQTAEIAKKDDVFKSFLEVEFTVNDLESLIKFVYFYAPAGIEVLEPEKAVIESHDLQDALMLMSDITHRYAEYISKNMTRKQLDEFAEKLYAKK